MVLFHEERVLIVSKLSNRMTDSVSDSWILVSSLLLEEIHELLHGLDILLVSIFSLSLNVIVLSDLGDSHNRSVNALPGVLIDQFSDVVGINLFHSLFSGNNH